MWTVESSKQDQDLDFKIGGKKMHKLLKRRHGIYEEQERSMIYGKEKKNMRTDYGLGFDIEDKIKDEWSEYDKMVARTHLENYGQIIIDVKFRTPIDNEHDLYVISGLIRAIG